MKMEVSVSDEKLEEYWQLLGDIPVDDNGKIQEEFSIELENSVQVWPKGVDRKDIWEFFDDNYSGGLAELMNVK